MTVAPDLGFTPDEVLRLLSDVLGDKVLVADRVCDWLNDHVRNPRDAHVLLHTMATCTAQLAGFTPKPGHMVAVEIKDGADPSWEKRTVAQMVACAGNDDLDTLTALILTVVKHEHGMEAFVEVLAEMVGMFRGIADAKEKTQ